MDLHLQFYRVIGTNRRLHESLGDLALVDANSLLLTASRYALTGGGKSLCPDVGTVAGGQAARPAAIALYWSLRFDPDEL